MAKNLASSLTDSPLNEHIFKNVTPGSLKRPVIKSMLQVYKFPEKNFIHKFHF